ncbi:MAG: hypothetical protein HOL01_22775 [Planctomycetaceae bacterium]|nr:hypothetical protein [Planctomycetaceae bacterium]
MNGPDILESVSANAQPGWSKIRIGIEAAGESGEPTPKEKSSGGLHRFCRLSGL